jgi:hypothetical protein
MSIEDIIAKLKHEWSQPRNPVPAGDLEPMAFACNFSEEGVSADELSKLGLTVPPALLQFWTIARWGKLFQDCTYGQWGLEILTPAGAASITAREMQQRQADYQASDLVFGRFLGDSDLLVLRCDPAAT